MACDAMAAKTVTIPLGAIRDIQVVHMEPADQRPRPQLGRGSAIFPRII